MPNEQRDTYVGKSAAIKEAMDFAFWMERRLSPKGLSEIRKILGDPIGRKVFLDALGVRPIREDPKRATSEGGTQ